MYVCMYYSKTNIWKKRETSHSKSEDSEKKPLIEESNENDISDKENTIAPDGSKMKGKQDIDRSDKSSVSLVNVLIKSFGFDVLIGIIWSLMNMCLDFCNPVLLK